MIRLLTFVALASLLIPACKHNTATDNKNVPSPPEYKITQGACGSVLYRENLAATLEIAFDSLKTRKVEEYSKYCPAAPCYNVELDYFKIEVVDQDSVTPSEQFYAVRVLDKATGMQVQSVSDVITTKGNLFTILWCPD